jgi:hypothetical protein
LRSMGSPSLGDASDRLFGGGDFSVLDVE